MKTESSKKQFNFEGFNLTGYYTYWDSDDLEIFEIRTTNEDIDIEDYWAEHKIETVRDYLIKLLDDEVKELEMEQQLSNFGSAA